MAPKRRLLNVVKEDIEKRLISLLARQNIQINLNPGERFEQS